MSKHKSYLGDGAYADFDGYRIILTAEDGIRATNTIALEPEVYAALVGWAKRTIAELLPKGSPPHIWKRAVQS